MLQNAECYSKQNFPLTSEELKEESADLKYLLKWVEFIRIKAKGSVRRNHILVDKVVSHQGYELTILKPLYMLWIERLCKCMVKVYSQFSYCYVEI